MRLTGSLFQASVGKNEIRRLSQLSTAEGAELALTKKFRSGGRNSVFFTQSSQQASLPAEVA